MEFNVSDLETVARAAQQIEGNPMRLAGRMMGLGDAEQDAGVPVWAWATIAFGVGLAVVWLGLPAVTKRFGHAR